MEQILKELTNLQEQIAESKKATAQLEGRKEEVFNQLKKEFQVKTIAEAEKKRTSLEEKMKELETEIQEDFAKLKAEYEW